MKQATGAAILFVFTLVFTGCNAELMSNVVGELTKDASDHAITRNLSSNSPVSGRTLSRVAHQVIDGTLKSLLDYRKNQAVKQAAIQQRPVVYYITQNNTYQTRNVTYNTYQHPPRTQNPVYRVEAEPRETVRVISPKTKKRKTGKKVKYRISRQEDNRVIQEGEDIYISETDERVPLS